MHPNDTFEIKNADGKGGQWKQDHECDRHKNSMGIEAMYEEIVRNWHNVLDDIGTQHVLNDRLRASECVREWIGRTDV